MHAIRPLTLGVAYLATAVAMLAVDSVWLITMSDRLYKPLIGPLLAPQFALAPALVFYVIYVAGLVALAVVPAIASGSPTRALRNGAMLGFTAYATYDLTNQATLAQWSTVLTLADMAWGTMLSGFAATIGAFAGIRFHR
jgi:uncharacterized membrane protein